MHEIPLAGFSVGGLLQRTSPRLTETHSNARGIDNTGICNSGGQPIGHRSALGGSGGRSEGGCPVLCPIWWTVLSVLLSTGVRVSGLNYAHHTGE